MDELTEKGLLGSLRVLDLTDEKGYLCGRILADLGADVIKVEPPGGCPGRRLGPFYHNKPHPERSLYWFAYNLNKRSITLNLETQDGREIFTQMVKSSDVVVESFPVGYLSSLGLGYAELSALNSRVILISISPFGQTGPRKDYKTSDIVALASSGLMYLIGDPDRPPIRITFPQAYLNAGAEAAVGGLIAYHARELSGEGQHVDVSIQLCTTLSMLMAPIAYQCDGTIIKRSGSHRRGVSRVPVRQQWPCKDGYVSFSLFLWDTGRKKAPALVKWMESEGMADDFLRSVDWQTFDQEGTEEKVERATETITKFFMTHTQDELFEGSVERGILLYPVCRVEGMLKSPQLKAREYWVQVEHPELGKTITYPGPFIKMSGTPLTRFRRAPLIGEHNEEIYVKELGLSLHDLCVLKKANII